MLYSKSCEYSIRALTYLSANAQKKKYTLVKEISEKTNIPYAYLYKIFHDLTNNTKWIASKKGRNGGFTMAVESHKIKLMDIIKLCDGVQTVNKCILGGGKECLKDLKCNMHADCSNILDEITAFFEKMTLNDIAEINPF
jgi:Rrf2 family nitric oxide-sensitive transcriptional repressor